MKGWDMPVNISKLLTVDFCWQLNDTTLKTLLYVIIFQNCGSGCS